jgi:hypothetical protein
LSEAAALPVSFAGISAHARSARMVKKPVIFPAGASLKRQSQPCAGAICCKIRLITLRSGPAPVREIASKRPVVARIEEPEFPPEQRRRKWHCAQDPTRGRYAAKAVPPWVQSSRLQASFGRAHHNSLGHNLAPTQNR